jgi:hypothetical protein
VFLQSHNIGRPCRILFCNYFVRSAGFVFLLTGFAKLWSAFGAAGILAIPDQVLGVQYRPLLVMAGLLELGIAYVCIFTGKHNLSLALTAWIATEFLLYRIGLLLLANPHPCRCLGDVTDALHISPVVADNLMKGVLTYLLVGSYGVLLSNWLNKRMKKHNINNGAAPTT